LTIQNRKAQDFARNHGLSARPSKSVIAVSFKEHEHGN
jgi:hypothetical protein